MSSPVFFRDSIAARAAPLKFRQIGNPYAFLNGVGIEPILDEVRKGHNLVEIAEILDVSIGVMLRWIDFEGHIQALDEAFKFSAEGHLATAAKAIKQASNDFELKKAKELANHGRFMASKMDRHKYGAEVQKQQTGNVIQFVLHMGQGDKPKEINVIEGSATPLPAHGEIINDETGFVMLSAPPPPGTLFPTPEGVAPPDDIGPFDDEPFLPCMTDAPAYIV